MKYATLLALTASASAKDLDVFNIKNFMTPDLIKPLMESTSKAAKDVMGGKTVGVEAGSKVAWSQCGDDKNVFTLDMSQTAAIPDPLVKGQDVKLHLVGALSDGIDLTKIHVNVKLNGFPLYNHDDTDAGKHYDDGIDYTYGWNVPSYAPPGKYSVTLTGVDTDGKSNDFCVAAEFSL